MACERNWRESDGYNAIMGVARLDSYESPYDVGLKHFGGMCDAHLAVTGDLLYGNEVPPYAEHASPERMAGFLRSDKGDWPAAEYFDLLRHGTAAVDDLKRAARILRRYTNWAKRWGQEVRFEYDGEHIKDGQLGETWVAIYRVPVDVDTDDMTEGEAEQYDQDPRFERQ